MSAKQTKKNSGKRVAMTVLCIVLGVILIGMLAGTIFVNQLYGKMNYVDPETEVTLSQEELDELLGSDEPVPDVTGPVMDENEIQWGEKHDIQIGGEEDDNVINILLIGQDARPGWGRSRSDSMILCTINKEKKTLTMTSFLRDLYVQIPGYADNKLNATYVAGGMKLLNDTLEHNFGIHVDGNVEVDFSRFAQLVDLLGGVDMELRNDEAVFINAQCRSGLTGGMQHLTGEQALHYSRIRSLDLDSDFSRTNRQRKVLNALIEKFKGSNLTTILALLDEALPMVTTDMTQAEIVSLVTEVFPLLKDMKIVSQRVPSDGTYSCPMIRGMSVVLADMDAAREFLKETLGD
jgi:LCP family protein required for cell wall assembly